jgi:hypothetical protein
MCPTARTSHRTPNFAKLFLKQSIYDYRAIEQTGKMPVYPTLTPTEIVFLHQHHYLE